jgi:hypothetical protein
MNTAQATTDGRGLRISSIGDLKTTDVTSTYKEVEVSKVEYEECVAHDLLSKDKYSLLMIEAMKSGVMPHHKIHYGRVGRRVFVKQISESVRTVWHSSGTIIYTIKEK